jgi:hypothetical protein
MNRLEGRRQARVRGRAEPRRGGCAAGQAGPEPQYDEDVQQPVEHGLLAGLGVQHLPGQERYHLVGPTESSRISLARCTAEERS